MLGVVWFMSGDIKTDQVGSHPVERRFWLLVTAVFVLAIAVCLGAVYWVSKPYLQENQRAVLQTEVERNATALRIVLLEHEQLLSYVAANPNIVSLVVGNSNHVSEIDAYFQQLTVPASTVRIEVHDILRDRVFARGYRYTEAVNQDLTDQAAIERVLEQIDGVATHVDVLEQDDQLRLVLSVPVRQFDYVEGTVSVEILMPMTEIFAHTSVTEPPTIVTAPTPEDSTNAASAPVGRTGLHIAMVANKESLAKVGRDLIEAVAFWISVLLVIPFAVFGIIGRSVIVRPHLELGRSEALLKSQKQQLSELAAVARNANEGIIVTDLNERILWVNPSFESVNGYSAEEVVGRSPGSFLQGAETSLDARQEMRMAIDARKPVEVELDNFTKDGRHLRVRVSITPLRNDDGETYGFMAVQNDVTDAHAQRAALIEANRKIEQQALHDPLTGLPNRRALDQLLEERNAQGDGHLTLVRIDLDHFKYVNDTMGHAAGDHVLEVVAKILRDETKSGDLPARVGGDEFLVLLRSGAGSEAGCQLAQRLLTRIKEPTIFENKTVQVGASFGVASTLDGLVDASDILVGADAALYSAKDSGRNAVKLYSPELHRDAVEKRSLAAEIRLAMTNGEFVPYYQPQIEAGSRRVSGVETLVRWQHPSRGLLFPAEFLHVAQQLLVLDDIDEIVLRQAMEDIDAAAVKGLHVPKLSFNITAHRLKSARVVELVKAKRPSQTTIAFEILESVLLDDQTTEFKFQLDRLRDAGIAVEIDDFGSGHASIIGLMEVRPDAMKIDQRLIMPITGSRVHENLVRSLVSIARSMDIDVVAEGVETEEHAVLLEEIGVTHLQGYHFSKALPIDELQVFVQDRQETYPVRSRA